LAAQPSKGLGFKSRLEIFYVYTQLRLGLALRAAFPAHRPIFTYFYGKSPRDYLIFVYFINYHISINIHNELGRENSAVCALIDKFQIIHWLRSKLISVVKIDGFINTGWRRVYAFFYCHSGQQSRRADLLSLLGMYLAVAIFCVYTVAGLPPFCYSLCLLTFM